MEVELWADYFYYGRRLSMAELIIQSRRVVTPEGTRAGCLYIRDGRIERVADFEDIDKNIELLAVGDSVVMPGLIDAHVHINDPGRSDWEGFETATRAAAAGGTTTLVDMPLNSIPATTSVAGLEAKLARSEEHTSELQSRPHLVCRLLLEKKN